MSESLWTRGLQHAGAPLSSTISQSLLKFMFTELTMQSNHLILFTCFSSCPQSLPAPGFFPMSQFFALGGQSTGGSATATVLPVNTQCWLPLGLTDLISLLSRGLSRIFSSTTVRKRQFFGAQPSLWSNPHICTRLLEKPWLWLYGPLSAFECDVSAF